MTAQVEGLGGLGVDAQYDQTLFALAALLASSLVYNSPGALDENAIAALGLVSRLARKIEADEAGGNSDHLPDLWWVLRDFALELVNADGYEIDSDEYLERSLRRTNRRESDEYRAAIALAFERRRCATLPRPYEAESDLRGDTNKAPRPAFAAALADFRRRLLSERPRPKRVRGAALRGKTFVALAATYVDAFNAGATPVVSSAWTAVVKAECISCVEINQRHVETQKFDFTQAMRQWTRASPPMRQHWKPSQTTHQKQPSQPRGLRGAELATGSWQRRRTTRSCARALAIGR